eukprot:CCRYP_012675-RA/>CCRYP_012675-RA protein AED:0.41 eAED:0.41 QI:0/-1/0/1/-1/1/1/0/255
MSEMDDKPTEDLNSNNNQEEPHKTVTITKIAPPSATEQNDRRAVRCRSRRERPRKLRPLSQDDNQDFNIVFNGQRFDTIEPDIESFVSSCFPGVAFPPPQTLSSMNDCPLRRSKLIRKRTLPSMSFLSTTTLAGAEKNRKREEQARQKLMAEEAAKKIVDSTVHLPDNDAGMCDESVKKDEGDVKLPSFDAPKNGNTAIPAEDGRAENHCQNSQDVAKQTNEPTVSTTVTVERTSNVLMPPLLVEFLNTLKRHNR